jgi:DNA-binding PadR family transcriptional regulator
MRATPYQTLTPLSLAVLRLLRERPMHPYEAHQLIRDRSIDYVIKVRPGSLYHAVERLHRLGLVAPVETAREGRRPERTVYAITEAGHDEYVANLRDLIRYPQEEFPVFAAAVEMLRTLGPDEAVRLLEQRVTALEVGLAAHEQVLASLAKRGLPRSASLQVEFCQATRRAELAWVRQLIEDIRSGEISWADETKESTP